MQSSHSQLNQLNHFFGGSISNLDGDRVLHYNNNHGLGKVVSVSLDAGISYTEYTMNMQESFSVSLPNKGVPALYFIYVLQGNIKYAWDKKAIDQKEIVELQTVILKGVKDTISVHLPKQSKTSFAVIRVDQIGGQQEFASEASALNKKLFTKFQPKDDGKPFAYHSTFNLKIKEQLLQIRGIKQSGIVRKLLIKGIIHFALALELMQHSKDLAGKDAPKTRLTRKELIRVQEAIEIIAKNPQRPYSISDLCREHGLSAIKLQEGFKALEGCTVANFVKKKRVDMAEKLLKEGDLNISEVVYSIGFTSRSYFSKIFKKRFKCTPKYYQEHCKDMAVV